MFPRATAPDPVEPLGLRARPRLVAEGDRDQERLAAIGRMAAGVAHDFNNVVTVVGLCAELLETQPGLDESGHEQVALIRREAERGAAMVWQILDVAHRGPIDRAPVDLDDFFAGLLPVLRRIEPARISVDVHADGAGHRVSADAMRLEQVVWNLATNATDAMPGRGRIDISLTGGTVGGDRRVRIAVKDSGHGIPADVLPRIFEPFFSTKAAGKGTGLGLAQVQGLVAQHDGRIEVTSMPGQGTTVAISLPALD